MKTLAILGIIAGIILIIMIFLKKPIPQAIESDEKEKNQNEFDEDDLIQDNLIQEEFQETTIKDMFEDKGSILAMIGAFIFFIALILIFYFKFYIGDF